MKPFICDVYMGGGGGRGGAWDLWLCGYSVTCIVLLFTVFVHVGENVGCCAALLDPTIGPCDWVV